MLWLKIFNGPVAVAYSRLTSITPIKKSKSTEDMITWFVDWWSNTRWNVAL